MRWSRKIRIDLKPQNDFHQAKKKGRRNGALPASLTGEVLLLQRQGHKARVAGSADKQQK